MSNSTPEARLRRVHDNVEYSLVGEVTLGRHSDCDIVIDDEGGVSRRHARLTGSGDGVFVSDLGSLNGTLVNGDVASEQTELHNGDRLVFDEYEYEVIIPAVEEENFDDDVTRIANRDEILERMAAATVEAESESKTSTAGSEISIDNEVPIHEVAVNEIVPNEVHAAEFQLSDAGEITDSTRNPPLDSDPQLDDTGPEVSDDNDERGSIPASDPFDRIIADPSDAEPGEPADPLPVSIPEEPPEPEPSLVEVPEPETAELAPEPSSIEAPEPEAAEPAPAPSSIKAPEPEPAEPAPAPAPPSVAVPETPREPAPPPPARQPKVSAASKADKQAQPPPSESDADVPDEADLPGAWANTAAVMNTDNQTMIAQYVVPARNAPAEVDISTITVPALVIRTGDFEGKVLTLNAPATEWLVGSGASCDLRIKQEGISSRHAVFVREQNKLKLCDELSVNGTFISGNRINVGYISHGDVLRFGPVECELFMPNFKKGSAGGRKGSTGSTNGASRKKKRGSKAWLKGLLVAAVLIPVIAVAVLLLLPQ